MIKFEDIKKIIEFDDDYSLTAKIFSQYTKYAGADTSAFVSDSINFGRDNAVENIDGVEIAAAQWSAILDSSTCEYCSERDEQIISVDDPEYYEFQPPAHPYCRCIYIYITAEEQQINDTEAEAVQPTWESPPEEDKIRLRYFNLLKDGTASEEDIENMAGLFGERGEKAIREMASLLGINNSLFNQYIDNPDDEYIDEGFDSEYDSPF